MQLHRPKVSKYFIRLEVQLSTDQTNGAFVVIRVDNCSCVFVVESNFSIRGEARSQFVVNTNNDVAEVVMSTRGSQTVLAVEVGDAGAKRTNFIRTTDIPIPAVLQASGFGLVALTPVAVRTSGAETLPAYFAASIPCAQAMVSGYPAQCRFRR